MKPKKYDIEFKRSAIQLIKDKSLSLLKASEDLGVAKSTLHKWLSAAEKHGIDKAFPGKGYLHQEADTMRKLKRENDVLKRERDILKKALTIFSLP